MAYNISVKAITDKFKGIWKRLPHMTRGRDAKRKKRGTDKRRKIAFYWTDYYLILLHMFVIWSYTATLYMFKGLNTISSLNWGENSFTEDSRFKRLLVDTLEW